jgi:ABC-type lipoprotein release transport system permease subunit
MVALVMAIALLLATAASWFPSRLIARRDPAEGLRYE